MFSAFLSPPHRGGQTADDSPMLLHGIFPPITTPFYPDGRVYLKKLEHNESVDGQVVMWAALLRETSMFESKILEFGNVLTFDLDAGLDDEAWLKVDETRAEAGAGDDGQLYLL